MTQGFRIMDDQLRACQAFKKFRLLLRIENRRIEDQGLVFGPYREALDVSPGRNARAEDEDRLQRPRTAKPPSKIA